MGLPNSGWSRATTHMPRAGCWEAECCPLDRGLCQVLKRSTNVCELVKLESAVCVPSVSLPVGEEEGVLAVCVYVYVRPTCKSC